jgi:molybdate transport system substrate-binding protein
MRLILVVLLLFSRGAASADLRLLSAASMQSVLKEVGPQFERANGHRLIVQFDTMGSIDTRVRAGESPDFIIGSGQSMSGLLQAGRIDARSLITFARVGVGLAAPVGAPVPELKTAGDFRRILIEATAVMYADPAKGGAAGIHVAHLIQRLGIDAELAPKTRYGAGGNVAELLAKQPVGTIGLTQISEIVGKPYVQYVGPLPAELQNYTVFAGGRPIGVSSTPVLESFVRFLRTPAVVAAMKANGMEVADH